MNLRQLISSYPPKNPCDDFPDPALREIVFDSRKADASSLFVCLRGKIQDGHRYAVSAYQNGCRVFAAEEPLPLPGDATVLLYPDTRAALAALSAIFYGFPEKELTVVGVTGTKGKTTVSYLSYLLLNASGISAGYLGTNGYRYGKVSGKTDNTTPESSELRRLMREMADAGVRVLVMEVSSQALADGRVRGIPFDTVLFTNLSPDHIGPYEHADFEAYLSAKRSLFTDFGARHLILNRDDPFSRRMLPDNLDGVTVETCSVSPDSADPFLPCPTLSASDPRLTALETGAPGVSFLLSENGKPWSKVSLSLPGLPNLYNALSALLICRRFGVPVKETASLLSGIRVPGRSESVPGPEGVSVLIDYAHNPQSLSATLRTLREYPIRGRLILLFGSVGGRTECRRAPMGEIASRLADCCILTSDNPDFEDPEEIIADILSGFVSDCPRYIIPDRAEAIRFALREARPGDILLLAGKGHETYQLINGEKIPFSEKEIVSDWLLSHSPSVKA